MLLTQPASHFIILKRTIGLIDWNLEINISVNQINQ